MWAMRSSRGGGGPSNMTTAPTCMCEACFSWCRNPASIALRRSLWPWLDTLPTLTATIRPVKLLATVAVGAVLAAVLLLAACDSSSADGEAAAPASLKVDRFDSAAAWRLLEYQVELGPRPAGSEPSRRLATRPRRLLPRGRFEPVPGGLRNVVGTVHGREPGYIVVGAHYDTKDIPGF